MNLPSYNSNTILPSYNDGFFLIYSIESNDKVTYPDEYLIQMSTRKNYFNELSVSDSLKIASKDRMINITKKIRISQNKRLNSNCVLKIDEEYYKIYNIYHFTNKDGFLESDITLVFYDKEIKFKKDVINGQR